MLGAHAYVVIRVRSFFTTFLLVCISVILLISNSLMFLFYYFFILRCFNRINIVIVGINFVLVYCAQKFIFMKTKLHYFTLLFLLTLLNLPAYSALYLIGSATSAGWTVGDAIEMTETSPGSISTSGQVN